MPRTKRWRSRCSLRRARTRKSVFGSVVDPLVVAGTSPPSPGADLVFRDLEADARRLVDEAVERAQIAGVRAHGETRCGAPAFELLQAAKRRDADLIVMGTHGRRGLKHFLMGSVAETVLRAGVGTGARGPG